ncbi:F-box/WD repeat-containing protein 8-like [Lineus longissimus]|uniref:F-box/WD repeat-containing protein 8-like n=1 Tax=Lineus longissimus TaxID=88925 RepID=UPI002B4D924D
MSNNKYLLEEFRLKWREELETDKPQKSSTKSSQSSGGTAGCSSDSVGIKSSYSDHPLNANVLHPGSKPTLANKRANVSDDLFGFDVKVKGQQEPCPRGHYFDTSSVSKIKNHVPGTNKRKERSDSGDELEKGAVIKTGTKQQLAYNPFSMVDQLLSSPETFRINNEKCNSEGKKCIDSSSIEPATKRRRCLTAPVLTKSEIVSTEIRPRCVKTDHAVKDTKDGVLVDILIADLDEINEIPFFDCSLPRELAMNIFKHFDMKDLCRCAQVSKSWRSLAEDELLWCMVCHKMGYDKELVTASHEDWKGRVRETYSSNKSLIYNWKNRIGKFSTFEYVQGGVLSAGHSRDKLIVGGYTNCHVSIWDLENDTKCILQPSTTALVLNDGEDGDGAIPNFVNNVAVNKHITAASYNQGMFDIWYNDGDLKPVQSFQSTRPPMTCELCVARDKPVVAYSWDRHIRVDSANSEKVFFCVDEIDFGGHISHLRLVPRQSYSSTGSSNLLIASTPSYVNLHIPGEPRSNMTTVHEVAQTHVTSLDAGLDLLACGVTYYSFLSNCKIFLYDLHTGREQAALSGFDGSGTKWINLADSPQNHIISADFCRRFYIHDLRQPTPVFREATNFLISTIQMCDWKVVCGGEDGQTAVYDQRMGQKLWEFHNRHPVRYSHFQNDYLVTANVPVNHFPEQDDGDQVMMHKRYRGVIQLYNFSVNQDTEGIQSICSSAFDEPIGYDYNINLAMPYDVV